MPKIKRKLSKRDTPTVDKIPKQKDTRGKGSEMKGPVAKDILAVVLKEYSKNSNKANAAKMKQYMRGQFEYFGLPTPLRREIDKKIVSGVPPLTRECVIEIVKLSWNEPQREVQHFGMEIAKKYKKSLAGTDAATCLDGLDLAKFMVVNKSWWDTVDLIASHLVGELTKEQPKAVNKVLDKWIKDDNMWLRRTAILHQLSYKHETHADTLFRYCLNCCHEKEFFIQKAIGWALRQYYRHDQEAVKAFVEDHANELAPLSKREALKHA